MIFLRLSLRFSSLCGIGLSCSLYEYPLLCNASWYGVAASSKTCSSDEISDTLLLIVLGIFLVMLGGLICCAHKAGRLMVLHMA